MIDAALEAAIDRVGRDRVFSRARSLGYSPGIDPEKWVWWGIVHELEAEGPLAGLREAKPSHHNQEE